MRSPNCHCDPYEADEDEWGRIQCRWNSAAGDGGSHEAGMKGSAVRENVGDAERKDTGLNSSHSHH